MNFNQEAPNVVTEAQFKYLLEEEGFFAEVVCQEEPEHKYGHWRGSWFFKAVDSQGETEKLLVPFRTDPRKGIQVREFKTASGLISFLLSLGFKEMAFPMEPGKKMRLKL